MLSRKNDDLKAGYLPDNWSQDVETMLGEVYQEYLQNGAKFRVIGMTFPDEVVLNVTFQSENEGLSTFSYQVSADLMGKNDPQKLWPKMIDSIGFVLDELFDQIKRGELIGYVTEWKKIEFQKEEFYFKITREDIELTLKANQLLAQS